MKKVLRNTIPLSDNDELKDRLSFQYKALAELNRAITSDQYSRNEAFANLVDLKYKRTVNRIARMESTARSRRLI